MADFLEDHINLKHYFFNFPLGRKSGHFPHSLSRVRGDITELTDDRRYHLTARRIEG